MPVLLDAEAVGCQGRGEGSEENGRREILLVGCAGWEVVTGLR